MVFEMYPKLVIGDVVIDPPLVLAPMSGVTDAPFRRLVKAVSAGGLGLQCTEFVNSEALARGIPCMLRAVRIEAGDHPVAVQIYGREPARMVEAALIAQDGGADIVDINAGCPVRNVVSHGWGASLMREPTLLASLVAAVRAALRVPVTVKIRAGWDACSVNAVEVARRLVDAGAAALTVHGRTRVQAYGGQADWDVIRQVREAVPVPVVGNGDVSSPETALRRFRETGVAGLMIGRATMGNPWIFRQISDALHQRAPFAPTLEQRLCWWLTYGEALQRTLPGKAVPGRMKQLAGPMTRGLPGGAELRRRIYACSTLEQMRQVLVDAGALGEPTCSDLRAVEAACG